MATLKQKQVAKKILENPSLPLGTAMREVGYADNTAIAPEKNLTSTKGWQELMEKYLPDDRLLAKHDEALEANRVISAINTDKQANGATTDFIEVPDHAIRLKAVELGYKIKKKLGPDVVQQFNTDEMKIEFIK